MADNELVYQEDALAVNTPPYILPHHFTIIVRHLSFPSESEHTYSSSKRNSHCVDLFSSFFKKITALLLQEFIECSSHIRH